jgi:hypothetical protein
MVIQHCKLLLAFLYNTLYSPSTFLAYSAQSVLLLPAFSGIFAAGFVFM